VVTALRACVSRLDLRFGPISVTQPARKLTLEMLYQFL